MRSSTLEGYPATTTGEAAIGRAPAEGPPAPGAMHPSGSPTSDGATDPALAVQSSDAPDGAIATERHGAASPRGATDSDWALRSRWSSLADAALLLAPAVILTAIMVATSREALLATGGDLKVYAAYADRILSGAVPYRDFHLEYPPLALIAMLLPRLVSPFGGADLATYAWLYTAGEALLAIVAGWLLARGAPNRTAALGTWALLVASASASVAWRYDLWPAVLVLVALLAARSNRPGLAGVAIGLGAAMKLFPIVLLPLLAVRAVAERDGPGLSRLLAGSLGVIVAVLAASVALASDSAFQWLSYQADRGLQIESTGAGLLLLGHVVGGWPVSVYNAFESMQVRSPAAEVFASAAGVLECVLVGAVLALAAARFRADIRIHAQVRFESIAEASVAAILAVLVPSKVFSAQYIVWFLPLVPFLSPRVRWFALGISALSTVIYPMNYAALWQLEPTMAIVLNVRNLLLVVLLGWLALGLRNGQVGAPLAPPRRGPGDTGRRRLTGLASMAHNALWVVAVAMRRGAAAWRVVLSG